MKKTLLTIAILFISGFCSAGNFDKLFEWDFLNSYYYNICCTSDNRVFLCGWPGCILISNDLGNNWSKPFSKTHNGLLSIDACDNTCIAVGYYGTVRYSTDSGLNWNIPEDSITSEKLNSVILFDSLTGAAFGGSGTIIKTTNGGKNWYRVESEIKYEIKTAVMTDSKTVFIAATGGLIFKSTDLGETWIKVETVAGSFTPYNFSYSFDKNIYLLTSNNIMKSTDDGATWLSFPRPDSKYYYFSYTKNGSGYFIGDQVNIISTLQDSIKTNTYNLDSTVFSKTFSVLLNIKFSNEVYGFAVGTDNLIYRTSDGGKSWNLLSYLHGFLKSFSGIYFINDSIGYIGANEENLYKTKNGGATWLPVPKLSNRGAYADIYSIFFFDEDKGLMLSNSLDVTLLKTIDGGKSVIRDTLYELNSNSGNFVHIENDRFFMYGGRVINGIMFRYFCINKNFDGTWWNKCVFDSIGIKCAYVTDPANIYMSGTIIDSTYLPNRPEMFNRGIILHSSDSGKTWNKFFIDFVKEVYAIYFEDNLHGIALTDRPKMILHTIDGGNNWEILDSNLIYRPNRITFIDDCYGFASGGKGDFFYSENHGRKWEKITLSDSLSLSGIAKTNKGVFLSGTLGGPYSSILRIKLKDSSTSVKDYIIDRISPAYIYPPYPNPSHNIINFDLVWDLKYSMKDLKLRIYNLYGIELEKPALEFFEKTNNTALVQWNANGLSSGIYLVQLEINGNKTARTQKVIVY